MSTGYRVDTSLLRQAVTGIDAAGVQLEDGRGTLESVSSRLQSDGVLEQDGRADDKIGTFVRQWREELHLFKEMLEGLKGALEGAAAAFDEVDNALATELREVATMVEPPPATARP